MSSGLRSDARLLKSKVRLLNGVFELRPEASTPVLSVRLSIGKPSTMMSGWLLLEIEPTPRITMDDDAPGTPDVDVTSRPAMRPAKALAKLGRCVCAIGSPSRDCCDAPNGRRDAVHGDAFQL